ncbi:MAG: hypothetical protein SAL70_40830 [Scytonema sp. PMC 1070.18]|nr:hypothetical protein [Scytonema sp. PMC 1070.18]
MQSGFQWAQHRIEQGINDVAISTPTQAVGNYELRIGASLARLVEKRLDNHIGGFGVTSADVY